MLVMLYVPELLPMHLLMDLTNSEMAIATAAGWLE
jgi:hypothetical protein